MARWVWRSSHRRALRWLQCFPRKICKLRHKQRRLRLGAGGAEDEATLERLRSALQLFEGTHPFHNYTKRRLYRAEAREGIKAKVLSWPPCVVYD